MYGTNNAYQLCCKDDFGQSKRLYVIVIVCTTPSTYTAAKKL